MTDAVRRALEFAAEHMHSDWPERCQEIVRRARAALSEQPAGRCYCDERGIGEPGVTCGDCPRDYGHCVTPSPTPVEQPKAAVRALPLDPDKPHAVKVPGFGYVDVRAVRAIEAALQGEPHDQA